MTSGADVLAIAGLVPMSTVDWPDRLVATVFCQGCPWRCVYCHNEAILDPRAPGSVPFARLEELLARRRGLLDGVVLSGGEATMQHAVVDAARRIRELGFSVGLHTGGAYPGRLRELLGGDDARRLVDWVGVDLKATPALYPETVGGGRAWARVAESIELVLGSGVETEFRTTVTPRLAGRLEELVAEAARLGIGSLILQRARADGAPSAFARALRERTQWAEEFREASRGAAAAGERLGVEVAVRE